MGESGVALPAHQKPGGMGGFAPSAKTPPNLFSTKLLKLLSVKSTWPFHQSLSLIGIVASTWLSSLLPASSLSSLLLIVVIVVLVIVALGVVALALAVAVAVAAAVAITAHDHKPTTQTGILSFRFHFCFVSKQKRNNHKPMTTTGTIFGRLVDVER